MASPRRIGAPDAKNRAVLMDAAERLMLEEGYAAVTSRGVARRAGLKYQLVYYYFRTMDDLLLAVFRRRAEEGLRQQAEALASPDPLRALWDYSTEPGVAEITVEFVALANHRKAIRDALTEYSMRFREAEIAALRTVLRRYDIDTDAFPPAVLAVMTAGLSRVLMLERSLDVTGGHAETLAFVEQHLRRLEGTRAEPVEQTRPRSWAEKQAEPPAPRTRSGPTARARSESPARKRSGSSARAGGESSTEEKRSDASAQTRAESSTARKRSGSAARAPAGSAKCVGDSSHTAR